MEGLQVGRIVHYVLRGEEPGVLGHRKGDHRAAMVIRLFESGGGELGKANLAVFLDGSNDLAIYSDSFVGKAEIQAGLVPPMWVTSVPYDAEGAPGSWHWPERA